MITKQQIIAINTIVSKRGLKDQKKDIMLEASGGRTEHSRELSFEEAGKLIAFLNADKSKKYQSIDRMIRKLLAMSHDLNWITTCMEVTPEGVKERKDYTALHEWVEKFGYLKKQLKDYKQEELPKLLSQFEQGPYTHYLKK